MVCVVPFQAFCPLFPNLVFMFHLHSKLFPGVPDSRTSRPSDPWPCWCSGNQHRCTAGCVSHLWQSSCRTDPGQRPAARCTRFCTSTKGDISEKVQRYGSFPTFPSLLYQYRLSFQNSRSASPSPYWVARARAQ